MPSPHPIRRWVALLSSAIGLGHRPLAAQPAGRGLAADELPLVAAAALKGLEIRVRILSRLDSKQVDLVLDSALVPATLQVSAQRALRGAVIDRGGGAPVLYRLTLRSFEPLSDSTAKVLSTLETRPTGGCDTKTFAVLLVKRDHRWTSNLVVEVVAPACRQPSEQVVHARPLSMRSAAVRSMHPRCNGLTRVRRRAVSRYTAWIPGRA